MEVLTMCFTFLFKKREPAETPLPCTDLNRVNRELAQFQSLQTGDPEELIATGRWTRPIPTVNP
jgi:hypothetical protein